MKTRSWCYFLLVLQPLIACGLPQRYSVVSGSAEISEDGTVMTVVQKSVYAAIEFDRLDLAPQERLQFIQPENGLVQITCTSGMTNHIQGKIVADCAVHAGNPEGFVFSPTAEVMAEALLISAGGEAQGRPDRDNQYLRDAAGVVVIDGVMSVGDLRIAADKCEHRGVIRAVDDNGSGGGMWICSPATR